MAIVTISHQHGSRGELIARQVAARLGFDFVTPERVSEIIRDRYRLDYSLENEAAGTPHAKGSSKLFASLLSAILTDMAVLRDLVVFECGGQFIFRSFPNALHIRIIASRELRAHNAIQDKSMSHEEALAQIDAQDRAQERLLRARFRHSSNTPEHYDLSINTGTIDENAALEIILSAVQLKKIGAFGMVSDESVERLRLRNQIRLQKALTKLSLEKNEPLAQFAHSSELVFARLLDFYGIRWEYEPRTFPLRHDEQGNLLEAFSPDFYLPDSDLYVELTTMKQSLVTKKNRKVKLLRELYPNIRIRLLYQKDFEDLIFKFAARRPQETHD
jgi:cytidylate kinase